MFLEGCLSVLNRRELTATSQPFFTEHDAGRDWRQISQADDSFLSPEYFYDLLLE